MTSDALEKSQKAPVIKPIRLFLAILAMLVFLISSPFTLGPYFSLMGRFAVGVFVAHQKWSGEHPFASWLAMATMGVCYVTSVMLVLSKVGLFERALRQAWRYWTWLLLTAAMAIAAFCALPSIPQLFAAVLAAGAEPVWLAWVSTGVIVLCANAVNVLFVVCVLTAWSTISDSPS